MGDPLQLPPVLESWNSDYDEGLAKTLFIRLSAIGYEPIMLRTQYRVVALSRESPLLHLTASCSIYQKKKKIM